ncbi:MAG: Dihydroorotate dehydrogenase B (NAD(+)), catalytic subunit [Parcubacteria group bacterium GW2011_GWA2_53_21]|nr:MAG: Dihydroorotate dehydrogenase B (NAD(+)), catalytic subunit [Parcubacteria group bacterium GW2011_GWA2_53_21]
MLETNFMNKDFSNPLVLASGIRDLTAANLRLAIESGAGGVTIKSISEETRSGHVNPTMIGTEHFFHNAARWF